MSNTELCTEEPCCTNTVGMDAGASAEASAPQQNQPSALECTVYGPNRPMTGFEALQNEWNDLLQRSRFNTVFLTYEWQTVWWEYLGEGDLWILAYRKEDTGQLVGIVPLYLTGVTSTEYGSFTGTRTFSIVGCLEVSDYLDVIVETGWESAVFQSFMDWLYSDEAPDWDVVDLCNLPQDSRTYVELPPIAKAADASVTVLREDVAPQFELPFRFETYLEETVDKKQRHEIRRKMRRAEREATVGFHMVSPIDNLVAEMDDFVALQQASKEDKAEFMTVEMRRFFNAMAQRMMDKGWLKLSFLTLNGEKAAALLAFEYNRRYLLYNSGYDPDAYSQLSPGWVQLGYVIQYAIVSGCTLFDFMQGDEAYKYRFGSQDYDVMRVLIQKA